MSTQFSDPPNGGQVIAFVKDAFTDEAGNVQIVYSATNGLAECAVSHRQFQIDPFGSDPNSINDAIIADARAQTNSPPSSHVVVFGGAARHYEG